MSFELYLSIVAIVLAAVASSTRAAIGIAAVAGLLHVLAYDALRDDAFITFRYVAHFVEGHGPVFNEGERVEGFSNWLQVVLLAAAHAMSGASLPMLAVGLGYLTTAASVLGAAVLVRRLGGGGEASVGAAVLVAGSGSFAAYGACGLETSLFTLLVLGALWLAAGHRWLVAGAVAALATATRPEGVVVLAALGIGALASGEKRWRRAAGVAGGFGAVVVPWVVARVAYYGWLIPNHLAAKRGQDPVWQLEQGLKYLARGAFDHLAYLAVGACAGWLWWRAHRAHRSPLGVRDVPTLASFAALVVVPVLLGGDWMPGYRFLVPAIVLGAVVVARLAPVLDRRLLALAAIFALVQGAFAPRMLPEVRRMNDVVAGEVEIGRWLGRSLPSDTWIASWAAGAIPFESRLPTIDMLGLSDEHIARHGKKRRRAAAGHVAYDSHYVVERAPAVITFLGGSGFETAPTDLLTREEIERYDVMREMEFEAYLDDYETVTFEFTRWGGSAGRFVNLWIRRSESARLVPMLVDESRGIRLVE